MTYHRSEWAWYVAQLVVESRVEDVPESILLIESMLLRAESPDEAYAKATAICSSSEHGYRNKLGTPVLQRYVGVHNIEDLQVDEPEDGLVLGVHVVSSSLQPTEKMVRDKNELSIFGGERFGFSLLNQ